MAIARVSRVRRVPIIREEQALNRPALRVSRRVPTKPSRPPDKPRYIVDFGASWGSLFQLYMMNSYLYYVLNRTVITDHDYDKLCKILLRGWRTAKHQHKHLVTMSDLSATTGFGIKYPGMVMGAATLLLDNYQEI